MRTENYYCLAVIWDRSRTTMRCVLVDISMILIVQEFICALSVIWNIVALALISIAAGRSKFLDSNLTNGWVFCAPK